MANAGCWLRGCKESDTLCLTVTGDSQIVSARVCRAHISDSLRELTRGIPAPDVELLTERYKIRIRTRDGERELTIDKTSLDATGEAHALAREIIDESPYLIAERPPRVDVEPDDG